MAWLVDFMYGGVYTLEKKQDDVKEYGYYVRAVRLGLCGYFGDSDGDGICDDGDASGVPGDNPCTGGETEFCDDNCRYTPNADQADANSNGVGDTCACCQCYQVIADEKVQAGCADNYSLGNDLDTTCTEYCLETCGRDDGEVTDDCYCPRWNPEEPAASCKDNCTLVELESFTARAGNRKVVVTFATASEIDNVGFNIYRSDSENGAYEKINEALIPAEGAPTEGAAYEFVDRGVKNRQTYWYQLEDVDLQGKSTRYGPESATPHLLGW